MAEQVIQIRAIRSLRELRSLPPSVAESIKSHERAQAHVEMDEAIRGINRAGGFVQAILNAEDRVNLFGGHLIIDDPDCWVYRLRAAVVLP